MKAVSRRIRRRVHADFPEEAEQVVQELAELTEDVLPDLPRDAAAIERIQLAALLVARRQRPSLDEALTLGRTDWRDLLVAANLESRNWRELVDRELARRWPWR